MDQTISYLLLVVKGMLVVWGIAGFTEYFFPAVSFGLQDPNFPPGVQFLHWLLILLTGVIFIAGYVRSWAPVRSATITMYAMLATLCFVETVDFNAFGGGGRRFIFMGFEYVMYTVLSAYLLKSSYLESRLLSRDE